jgi:hypothetical protein
VVNWKLTNDEEQTMQNMIIGPMFQMTALMLHENRAHPALMNAIGELCAQFVRGIPVIMRKYGAERVISTIEAYHKLNPAAAKSPWYPEVLDRMNRPEWQQLYVNAEHNSKYGIITISRESYSTAVNEELNRAIDWLHKHNIRRVILTGDFHLSTQMTGADTADFYPALENQIEGMNISRNWSLTARRLNDEFEVSSGLINGKRCMGGMLELMMHCHYLLAVEDAVLGMPEVTLPVVPGMER